MNGYSTRNQLQRAAHDDAQRELAERASRADAIIAAVSTVGMVVLAFVQVMEKLA